MKATGRMRGKGQLTIPESVRRAAHLSEGDPVEIELVEEGVLLRPQKVIDSTQAWFWTKAWQAGEAVASADIEADRVRTFNSGEEFLAALDE